MTSTVATGQACEMILRSRLVPSDTLRRLQYFPRALDAVAHAAERIKQPLRLEVVAAEAGMTPCAFSRYFTAKIGMTFSALLRLLRIERAIAELEAGDRAISELAHIAGYQSCCTFSRAFKEVVGETPSEYRRRFLFGTVQS